MLVLSQKIQTHLCDQRLILFCQVLHEKIVDDDIMYCLDFILSTQDGITGGLAKLPDCPPDPLHTYLGLSGLALVPFSELRPVDPELNITKRARDFLRTLHHKSEDCTKSTTNCLAL